MMIYLKTYFWRGKCNFLPDLFSPHSTSILDPPAKMVMMVMVMMMVMTMMKCSDIPHIECLSIVNQVHVAAVMHSTNLIWQPPSWDLSQLVSEKHLEKDWAQEKISFQKNFKCFMGCPLNILQKQDQCDLMLIKIICDYDDWRRWQQHLNLLPMEKPGELWEGESHSWGVGSST